MEKRGKICFKWKEKVVGQVCSIEGEVILPLMPFVDADPKEKKFVSMKLENEFDVDMLKFLEDNGIKWIAFQLSDYIREGRK